MELMLAYGAFGNNSVRYWGHRQLLSLIMLVTLPGMQNAKPDGAGILAL